MRLKNTCLLLIILVYAVAAHGQSASTTGLDAVITVEDAHTFIRTHPGVKPVLLELNSQADTTTRDLRLLRMKTGGVITIGQRTYKIIDRSEEHIFRASYIYLDGSSLSRPAIDSLRKLILTNYAAGVSFESLCDKYTMDGNPRHGDLGPFKSGMMAKEFEEAVRDHPNGKVFTVDVPGHQWYYVVKKTAENKDTYTATVLAIQQH